MRYFVLILFLVLAACDDGKGHAVQSNEAPYRAGDEEAGTLRPVIVEDSQTYIRIFKAESELELWSRAPGEVQYSLIKTYPICKWSGRLGPKLKEGDGQSPEGFYSVSKGRLNPNSAYHLSFNLGFPNAYDRAHGRTGSYLMVHGNCLSIGCYAMTDAGIEEIYGTVENSLDAGQRAVDVHVFPFRMTDQNMVAYKGNAWADFWVNLKEGYDLFEVSKIPPIIRVEDKAYVFDIGG